MQVKAGAAPDTGRATVIIDWVEDGGEGVLAASLHAAAFDDAGLDHVLRWARELTDPAPRSRERECPLSFFSVAAPE